MKSGSRALPFAVVAASLISAPLVYYTLGAPGYGDLPLEARIAASDQMRANRPDQAAFEAQAPALEPIDAPAEYLESVQQLRQIAPTRPDDLQAWELLTYHEAELRNYGAAAQAQARVIAIKGDTVEAADIVRQLDLMVAAADGFVSPEAETLITRIAALDPDNIAARYYTGSLFNQTDRADIAFRAWRSLVETESPTFHTRLARLQIENAAQRAGIPYTLPAEPGPDLETIQNAEDMSPEDRAAMIANMVSGLADRLATQGGPPSEWARLIRAYSVLGDTNNALIVLQEARMAFADNEDGLALINQVATEAGIGE